MCSKNERIMEEWKQNIDLHKFHDDLKQKRFSHFLTIQTAFFAIFGLLYKESYGQDGSGLPFICAIVAIIALLIAKTLASMDKRGRVYVDVIKSRLLILENEWGDLFPNNQLRTYGGHFDILVRKSQSTIDEYVKVRQIRGNDSFKEYLLQGPAHRGEENIIKIFITLWVFLFVCALILSIKNFIV